MRTFCCVIFGGNTKCKLLSLAFVIAFIFCGCIKPRVKPNAPDPVAMAEKTNPARAVSEHSGSQDTAINLSGWKGILDEPKMLDFVVAEVGKESVTYGEALYFVEQSARGQNIELDKIPAGERQKLFATALQNLITRKLILAESKELGYDISDVRVLAFIHSEIPEINEKFGGDIEKYVEARNLDYQSFFDDMKSEMVYKAYLGNNVFPRVSVSPEEIREYYEKNKDKYQEKTQVHLYAVTIYKKEGALDRAKEVLGKLKNGEDFEKLAKEYSEDNEKRDKGGDWGWITFDNFSSKNISETAFALKAGELSDIVETDLAYWLLKVSGIKAEETKPLAEAWDDIERYIRMTKINDALHDEIVRLQKKYRVIIHGGTGEKKAG